MTDPKVIDHPAQTAHNKESAAHVQSEASADLAAEVAEAAMAMAVVLTESPAKMVAVSVSPEKPALHMT